MKKIIFVIVVAIVLVGVGFFVLKGETSQPAPGNLPGSPPVEVSPRTTASSHFGPAVSVKLGKIPSSAEIVYRGNGVDYIYTMDKNGGNVAQITFDTPRSWEHAAVSYDRRYIAANTFDKIDKMWVFDLQKQTEVELVPSFFTAGGGGLDWSPDGFIYFSGRPTEEGERNIYKIKPDGSELTQLTHIVKRLAPPTPELSWASDISVSPDGKQVAYIRMVLRRRDSGTVVGDSKDDMLVHAEVWSMDSDGSNQKRVNDGGNELGMYGYDWIGAYDPEHSPDGTQIVFSKTNTAYRNQPQNTAHDIYITNLDGTGVRRVTQPGPISIVPDWRDNQIVYTEMGSKDNAGAVIINVDGTGYRRLKTGAFMAKWIPSK